MAKAKYKEFYELMVQNNEEDFKKFSELHDRYALNPDELQEEYNEQGKEILKIIREWEDKLCGRSEGSGYGSYSGNLAEKFWGEIRKHFSEIDSIGIVVFKVNKINLK